ncbi:transposase, partial [Shigella sonnei]|uniref:transposase n=1 Tax=Shigella sonnei TaxID=624 RepID=UPI0011BCF5D7
MSRKTQRYSKEFKAEAVRTVPENQLSISEGASRLSLPEGTLGQWVTAARKGLGTPGSRTVAELESEILQLRKALNEARKELRLRCKQKRKFRATTNSNHNLPVAPNLPNQTFAPTAPNQVWVADLTYVATQEGWLYLAGIKDVYTCEI